MIIKLSPAGYDVELKVTKAGDTLIINGVALDFTQLEDGSTLPADAVGSEWVTRTVERIYGELIVTLTLPHVADAPESVRYPADIFNPADGPVHLPGLDAGPAQQPAVSGVIDWSRVVTQGMKDQAAADQYLAQVVAENAARRDVADKAIAPLQDAVELEEATEVEVALLKEWKRYRLALVRLPEQEGYPNSIEWPALPA